MTKFPNFFDPKQAIFPQTFQIWKKGTSPTSTNVLPPSDPPPPSTLWHQGPQWRIWLWVLLAQFAGLLLRQRAVHLQERLQLAFKVAHVLRHWNKAGPMLQKALYSLFHLFFFFPLEGVGWEWWWWWGGGGGDWRHCILLFCFLFFFFFHQHQDWPSNTWINPSKTQCQHQVWHSNTWINPWRQCQHQVWHSDTWINPWRHSVSTKSDTPTPESTIEDTVSAPSLALQHLNQSTLARQHQWQVWHSNTGINPSKTQCQHQVWHSQHLNQSTLARHSVSTKSDTPTPESIQARHSISTKSDTPTPESINTSKTVSAPSLALQHLNQS